MALLTEVSKHYGKLKFYLNGQWVEPKSNRTFETTNPAAGCETLMTGEGACPIYESFRSGGTNGTIDGSKQALREIKIIP